MEKTLEIEVYIRFCDTDAVGHLNNTSHFKYMEEARTKFFRLIHPNRSDSSSFILASITCDYIEQAYAEQTLKVITKVSKIGTKSFVLSHIIKEKETDKLVAKGEAVTVCFDVNRQKTIPISEELRENLKLYLKEEQIQ